MSPLFDLSGQAIDRPKLTIQAAELLHDNASTIAYACSQAQEDEVVIAVVRVDLSFGGIWTVPLSQLHDQVPALEDGGWSLILSPGAGRDEIEERALKMARLAFKRWEAMRRWVSRHS